MKYVHPCYDDCSLISPFDCVSDCDAITSETCSHKAAGGAWETCTSGNLCEHRDLYDYYAELEESS